MKPNVFIVGAAKSGTTALATWLRDHPQGFMPPLKEPGFWSDHVAGETFARLETVEDYLALYAKADPGTHRVVVDATTAYMMTAQAAPRILEFQPEARFVAILRDPMTMAEAFHMEQVFNTYEDVEDFARAWALQEDRAAGRHMPPRCREPRILQYRDVASIGTQLERLAGQVPADRLLVLFHEDLAGDPRALWLRLQAFLGLDDDGRTEFPVVGGAHFNRFPKLAALYQNPPPALTPVVRTLKRGLLLGAPRGAVNLVKTALMRRGRRAPAPPELRREMAEVFAPEIAKVVRLTGRDLTHWGRP